MRRSALPLLLPALAAFALASLTACAAGDDFPTDLPDDAYPLEEMLLPRSDLPVDMEQEMTGAFDNAEWAQLFDVENVVGKLNQLEARGRVSTALREFSWSQPQLHFGDPAFIVVQSTLYTDVEAAEGSMSLFCGTLVDERTATDVTEFWVDEIGDGVQGLRIGERTEDGIYFVETLVCFRTGRIVHAVLQNGLAGTEDVALSVRVAKRMYEHVRSIFANLDPPASDPS